MIERHIAFRLLPDKAGSLESFFRSSYAPALSAQAGFRGAKLLRPTEGEDVLVMILRFTSQEAAQAWRESTEHKRLSPILKAFHQGGEVRVYDVLADVECAP